MHIGEELKVSVRFGHTRIHPPFSSFLPSIGFCRCDPDTRTLSFKADITICLIREILLILHIFIKSRKTFDS